MDVVARRFDVYLVPFDPVVGREIGKTRPSVVVSPDEMNINLGTAIVVPLTSARKRYPTRVACHFAGRAGELALDQMRTVDQSRLIKHLGTLDVTTQARLLVALRVMFS